MINLSCVASYVHILTIAVEIYAWQCFSLTIGKIEHLACMVETSMLCVQDQCSK